MNKVIRDGNVAVLYSPGYGAGWSTWAEDGAAEAMCMDERIVNAFLSGGPDAAAAAAKSLWPDQYTGGARALTAVWLPVGTVFEINEYDGSESVRIIANARFMTA
jgi:hypothetical protein